MGEDVAGVWKRRRRAALVVLYVSFALWGAIIGLAAGPESDRLPPAFWPRVNLFVAITAGLGAMWFCSSDARLVGRPLIDLARQGIFIGWPLGIPLYLLWARGIRGLGVLLLHGVLLFLLFVGVALGTMVLVDHV